MNNSNLSPYLDKFNNIKLVLFVESKPNSDKFYQLILSPEQIKNIHNFVGDIFTTEDNVNIELLVDDNKKYNFPNIRDEYSLEEIDILKSNDESE